MVNLYDFDETVYDGNSSFDFYVFCLHRKPRIVRYVPYQIWHLVLWILQIRDKTFMKSGLFVFVRDYSDIEAVVDDFWKSHFQKIKGWYQAKDHSDDVIISASPEFLLSPATDKLSVRKLIATIHDEKTGKVIGRNCYGEEKLVRFKAEMTDEVVKEAYSDHLSDTPMLNIAKEKYFVKKNKITKLY